jgi:hypothetical protein
MNIKTLHQGYQLSDIHRLNPNELGFYSGLMSECVTVIAFSEYSLDEKKYMRVVGMHCAGGIEGLYENDDMHEERKGMYESQLLQNKEGLLLRKKFMDGVVKNSSFMPHPDKLLIAAGISYAEEVNDFYKNAANFKLVPRDAKVILNKFSLKQKFKFPYKAHRLHHTLMPWAELSFCVCKSILALNNGTFNLNNTPEKLLERKKESVRVAAKLSAESNNK